MSIWVEPQITRPFVQFPNLKEDFHPEKDIPARSCQHRLSSYLYPMVHFERHTLSNGLRVILHRDPGTPIAVTNVLYNAGSRVESPTRTGLAHLFEHLMFSQSLHVEDFDEAIQHAGGDCNAFTNTDMTNFYNMIPVANLETALWLESDRMLGLKFSQEELDVQKKVVIEEFKETTLDQPYGNLWHLMAGQIYKQHPYRWPTIGLTPEHIAEVTLSEVRDFFHTWYRPNNAIICVAGNIDPQQVLSRIEAWFGQIPAGQNVLVPAILDPIQTSRREIITTDNVPLPALYMGFRCPGRLEPGYYAADLITDILANGPSSRLYRRLVMERELFSHLDCYQTGTLDPGVLMIEAKPAPGLSLEEAEKILWEELDDLASTVIADRELEKIKNKNEAAIAFSEVAIVHKAMNLAHCEWLGQPDLINEEIDHYRAVSTREVRDVAAELFQKQKANLVFYAK